MSERSSTAEFFACLTQRRTLGGTSSATIASWSMPSSPLSGVRISWDIHARKASFASFTSCSRTVSTFARMIWLRARTSSATQTTAVTAARASSHCGATESCSSTPSGCAADGGSSRPTHAHASPSSPRASTSWKVRSAASVAAGVPSAPAARAGASAPPSAPTSGPSSSTLRPTASRFGSESSSAILLFHTETRSCWSTAKIGAFAVSISAWSRSVCSRSAAFASWSWRACSRVCMCPAASAASLMSFCWSDAVSSRGFVSITQTVPILCPCHTSGAPA